VENPAFTDGTVASANWQATVPATSGDVALFLASQGESISGGHTAVGGIDGTTVQQQNYRWTTGYKNSASGTLIGAEYSSAKKFKIITIEITPAGATPTPTPTATPTPTPFVYASSRRYTMNWWDSKNLNEVPIQPLPTATPTPNPTPTATPTPAGGGGLLQPSDLTYAGYFTLPNQGGSYCAQSVYSPGHFTYRASNDTIFIQSHDYCRGAVEYQVPTADPSTHPAATVVSAPFSGSGFPKLCDATVGDSYCGLDGLWYDEVRDALCFVEWNKYAVAGSSFSQYGCRQRDGTNLGPWDIGNTKKVRGSIYAAPGGKVWLGGQGGSGASGENEGPAVYEIDPANPAGGTVTLMDHYFTTGIHCYDSASNRCEVRPNDARLVAGLGFQWPNSQVSNGGVVIGNTLLWTAVLGERACYFNPGCSAGQPGPNDQCDWGDYTNLCRNTVTGPDAAYEHNMLLFYDLADLEAVRNATKNSYDVHFYNHAFLADGNADLPDGSASNYNNQRVTAVQADTTGKRIFVLGNTQSGSTPRVYVYTYP